MCAACGVGEFGGFDGRPIENLADFRNIVDRQNEAALYPSERIRQRLKILSNEQAASIIVLGALIWRIAVE